MRHLKDKKILGALSILDFVVIIFILSLILPALYYFIKFNEKGYIEQKSLERFIANKVRDNMVNQTEMRTKYLDIDVSFKNLTKEGLKKIKAGDKEYSKDKTIIAEVLWVGEPVPNYFITDVGTLSNSVFIKTVPESSLYSLPAKIRLKGLIADGAFTSKDRVVKELAGLRFCPESYDAYFVVEAPPLVKRE